tara:strand:+ start:58 stop:621 length:564 start_codon:yes stop_codon:yes gene_type:complete
LIKGERGLANTTSLEIHHHGDNGSVRFSTLPSLGTYRGDGNPCSSSPLGSRKNSIAGFPQTDQKFSLKSPRSRSSSQRDGERSHWPRSKKQKEAVRLDSLREAAIESRKVKDELLSQHSGLEKEEEKGIRQYHESRHASAFGTKLAELEVKVEGTSHIHILDADTPKEQGRQLNRVVRVQRKDRKVE